MVKQWYWVMSNKCMKSDSTGVYRMICFWIHIFNSWRTQQLELVLTEELQHRCVVEHLPSKTNADSRYAMTLLWRCCIASMTERLCRAVGGNAPTLTAHCGDDLLKCPGCLPPSPPPALLPVKEQQSVCELADIRTLNCSKLRPRRKPCSISVSPLFYSYR